MDSETAPPTLPGILAGISSVNVQITNSATVSFRTETALALRQLSATFERIPTERQRIVALMEPQRSKQYEKLRQAGLVYGPSIATLTAYLEAHVNNDHGMAMPTLRLTPLGDKLSSAVKQLLEQATQPAPFSSDFVELADVVDELPER
jgi:hypothetical protein